MTTYCLELPARPRGQWIGWGASLLAHAGVLAWLLHAPPPMLPAAAPVPRMDFVLVPPRRPVVPVPVAIVLAPAAAPVAAPRTVRAAPARAAAHALDRAPAPSAAPAESNPVIAAETPAAGVPAAGDPAADAGTAPPAGSAAASDAVPAFDMGAARKTARLIEKHRKDGLVALPKPDPPLQRDDRLGRAIERARRPDCKSAYSGIGLLAVIPLAKDTLTGTGCKW